MDIPAAVPFPPTDARVRNSSASGVKRSGKRRAVTEKRHFFKAPKIGACSSLVLRPQSFKGEVVPHEIAENLRQLAMEFSQLAKQCSDKTIANEIEGISAELAEKARRLDTLFGEDGKRHSQAGL